MTTLREKAQTKVAVVVAVAEAERPSKTAQALAAAGVRAQLLPVLHPVPLEGAALRTALQGEPDWLLLTSPVGARALLAAGGPLKSAKVAALGQSTAQVLRGAGLEPFLPSKADAAALAAELPASGTALHVCSALASRELEQRLKARGIAYARAEAYTVVPRPLKPDEQAGLLAAAAITAASGSVVRALALAGAQHLPLAVIGPRTAAAAQQAGFERVAVAKGPSAQALAQAALGLLR